MVGVQSGVGQVSSLSRTVTPSGVFVAFWTVVSSAGKTSKWWFLSPESGLCWAGKSVASCRVLVQAEGRDRGHGAALDLAQVTCPCYTSITYAIGVFIKANGVG